MSDLGNKSSHRTRRKLLETSLGIAKRKLRRRRHLSQIGHLSTTTAQDVHPGEFKSITTIVVPEVQAPGSPSRFSKKVDYSLERLAYARTRGDLIKKHSGKFVVFVGEEMIGPFDSFPSAVREARKRYGRRPIYTKELIPDDTAR